MTYKRPKFNPSTGKLLSRNGKPTCECCGGPLSCEDSMPSTFTVRCSGITNAAGCSQSYSDNGQSVIVSPGTTTGFPYTYTYYGAYNGWDYSIEAYCGVDNLVYIGGVAVSKRDVATGIIRYALRGGRYVADTTAPCTRACEILPVLTCYDYGPYTFFRYVASGGTMSISA